MTPVNVKITRRERETVYRKTNQNKSSGTKSTHCPPGVHVVRVCAPQPEGNATAAYIAPLGTLRQTRCSGTVKQLHSRSHCYYTAVLKRIQPRKFLTPWTCPALIWNKISYLSSVTSVNVKITWRERKFYVKLTRAKAAAPRAPTTPRCSCCVYLCSSARR